MSLSLDPGDNENGIVHIKVYLQALKGQARTFRRKDLQ